MARARTDSETASKAQALREAADLGCTGAHRHPDGTWMACSTMEEYEKLTASTTEKSGLDLIAETQKIREQKGSKRKRKNRQWEKLRERGVSGIDTLSGGGLVSGKGMTFRPVDGDTDVFDDIDKARRRARQLGCIGVSRRISRSGRRVWTPCTNMTDYARATGSTALGRRYQARLERQRIRGIVQEELSRARRSRKRRKTRLIDEFYEIKGLGRRIRRGAAVFDPKAWDGDNDGLVQEGTPFERPSIPGINTNLPGEVHTRTKPKNFPSDTQRDRDRRTEAQKPRRDPNRMRPGKGPARRRGVIDARDAAGMRSEGSEEPMPPMKNFDWVYTNYGYEATSPGGTKIRITGPHQGNEDGSRGGKYWAIEDTEGKDVKGIGEYEPTLRDAKRVAEERVSRHDEGEEKRRVAEEENARRLAQIREERQRQRVVPPSSGMRSQRFTKADLNERRWKRTPKENLKELGEAIDKYVAFLEEHHRHNFAGDADTISAIDASDPGLVNEHDVLKGRIDDLAWVFEEARADLEELDFERDELQTELNRKVGAFDKANGELLGRGTGQNRPERRQIVRAVRDGEDKDKFLQSVFPDEMKDDPGHMEWLWDTVVEERNEIMLESETLENLQNQIAENQLGTETTMEELRALVQGRIDLHQGTAPVRLESGGRAVDPAAGMRSRRDALSDGNREWLRILQSNPGLWDEVPAAVRNVSSDKLRQDAMALRDTGFGHVGGMRSGGRQMGLEIIGKVKPEHRNKPENERTLYFVGGTTGAGKSTIIKDKKVRLPGDTEAAHIDPDHVKTGLRGWDIQNPMPVHHESRRVTDRIMNDAMNGGMDVVVQGTGKRTEHLRDAKKRGYKTSGHFVWVPGGEADRRIAQRKTEGGPNIPDHFGSLIAGELRNGIVSRQVTDGLYDEFYLWDNTGREPRLIAYRTQDGQFAIHGRKEFDDFFGSSGRHVESYWQKNK